MSQNRCEVLVVGGGPAGLAAAIALRQKGLDVVVAESLMPPIDKACGEGLMPDARQELGRLGVELTSDDGAEFTGIHFANRNHGREDSVTAAFPRGIGLGVRRLRLHTRLIERAAALGVRMRWGTGVNLRPDQTVELNGEPWAYGHLVGADGQSSRVRRWAGLETATLKSRRFGFRRHYRIAPWSRQVEVHWGRLGQAYITPVDEDEVCVATISRRSHARMNEVLAEMPFLCERLRRAEPTTPERGAVTTTRKLSHVIRGNVALIGDASGSADAVTGEGMAMAFRQALLLAEAIVRHDLERYDHSHGSTLEVPQTMAFLMLSMDRFPRLRDRAMRMFAGSPDLFARMLGIHVGEVSMAKFVLTHGLEFSLRFLVPVSSAS